jgi:Rap1a immunity proteins
MQIIAGETHRSQLARGRCNADQRASAPPARRSWWPWRRLALAVVLLAGYGPSLCSAAEAGGTGNELLSDCLVPDKGLFFYGYCLGFVVGVGNSSNSSGGNCPPKGVTRDQAKDVVVRYLQAHPEIRHYPATVLTQTALAEAFPCKR